MLRRWDDLPNFMRVPEVRPYWEALNKKRGQLVLKRGFDILVAWIMLVFLAIPMLIIAIAVKEWTRVTGICNRNLCRTIV